MITPQALQPGCRIQVVAPSGPFDAKAFALGLSWLKSRYDVRVSDTITSRDGFLAGSDDRRRNELVTALSDPECRAVIAARGGYGASRLLPSLPTGSLQRAPRWLVGFSDFTAIHWAAQRQGIASLHAANVTTLGTTPSLRDAWANALERPGSVQHYGDLDVAHSGVGEGRLMGGNLTVLASVAHGSPGGPREPTVLLLEDVGEAPYRLDRALTRLWAFGALDAVVGCVLGDFAECTDPRYDTRAIDVVVEFLGRLRVPILTGLPVGHAGRVVPLTLGHWATVDGPGRSLTVRPVR